MLSASVLLLLAGCNSGSRNLNNVTIPRAEYERLQAGQSRRFHPFSDGVALDTQTAQVCKTYDWQSRPARREFSGAVTPSPYEKAPLCTVVGGQKTGSHDAGSITISRAEYERLQAAQQNRFQPFSTGVALDTQTGQACKTTDSHIPSALLPSARGIPHTGRAAKTASPSPYENAPLCADLRNVN
jgi:hypothetical protein